MIMIHLGIYIGESYIYIYIYINTSYYIHTLKITKDIRKILIQFKQVT